MFKQCSKCTMCSQRKASDAPRLLSFGSASAPILVIDAVEPFADLTNPIVKDTFAMMNYANPDSLRMGGSQIHRQIATIENIHLYETFGSLEGVEVTWAQRCETDDAESNQGMVAACGVYTRFLIADRKILVVAEEGYQQLAIELPDFEEGKILKTKLGIVVTVFPLKEWGPKKRLSLYKSLINRAKKEVGLL